jgi:tetratricopeptide (TPR) repeat protein
MNQATIETALEQNPAAPGFAWLADRSLAHGDDQNAAQVLERALSHTPSHLLGNLVMGQLLLRQGDGVGARRRFEEALHSDPHCPAARRGMAQCLSLLGSDSAARDWVRALLFVDPLATEPPLMQPVEGAPEPVPEPEPEPAFDFAAPVLDETLDHLFDSDASLPDLQMEPESLAEAETFEVPVNQLGALLEEPAAVLDPQASIENAQPVSGSDVSQAIDELFGGDDDFGASSSVSGSLSEVVESASSAEISPDLGSEIDELLGGVAQLEEDPLLPEEAAASASGELDDLFADDEIAPVAVGHEVPVLTGPMAQAVEPQVLSPLAVTGPQEELGSAISEELDSLFGDGDGESDGPFVLPTTPTASGPQVVEELGDAADLADLTDLTDLVPHENAADLTELTDLADLEKVSDLVKPEGAGEVEAPTSSAATAPPTMAATADDPDDFGAAIGQELDNLFDDDDFGSPIPAILGATPPVEAPATEAPLVEAPAGELQNGESFAVEPETDLLGELDDILGPGSEGFAGVEDIGAEASVAPAAQPIAVIRDDELPGSDFLGSDFDLTADEIVPEAVSTIVEPRMPDVVVADLADEPDLDLSGSSLGGEESQSPDDEFVAPGAAPGIQVDSTKTLANIYAEQGMVEDAVRIFRELVAADPRDESLSKRLAELEALQGESGAVS